MLDQITSGLFERRRDGVRGYGSCDLEIVPITLAFLGRLRPISVSVAKGITVLANSRGRAVDHLHRIRAHPLHDGVSICGMSSCDGLEVMAREFIRVGVGER